jgi:hypothetical protein
MKRLKNVRYAIAVIAACAAMGIATDAKAQTENVNVSLTVSNLLTITEVSPINFGTLAAFKDTVGANVATIAISPAGVLGAPSNAAPAVIAVIDNTTATQAELTVEDGADSASINIEIDNVVPPTNGTAFALTAWMSSWNGAAATARTPATPWSQVFDADFNGVGLGSTLELGVTLNTVAGGAQYVDNIYTGNFDVIFSY